MAVGNYKSYEEMDVFWSSLPPRVKTVLYKPSRRLVLSSDEVSLFPQVPSRIRALPKYLLFSDVFVILQSATLVEYPLEWVWLDHLSSSSAQSDPNAPQMNNFRLILPELTIELQCKEFAHKSMWISCIVEAIGVNLNIPQFITARGDLTLDTQLQLIRMRESLEYTYQTIPEMKDGRYKGPWLNAKAHGNIGEYWHEPSGKLYKGSFKNGNFHGTGELLWFTDKEDRKKYIGQFSKGEMHGRGEMKYSNGDVYDGCWLGGKRNGYGTLEESSRKNSKYTGGWKDDKRNGYGVYDDRMKYERYLGMWLDNHQYGPGIMVTSTGCYCEMTFTNSPASSSASLNAGIASDGLILDPNGSSFMGKIAPGFKLAGKGVMTLTNGVVIDGLFGGSWHGGIEIQKATLNNGVSAISPKRPVRSNKKKASMDLHIAKLDKRIGTCTVLASNKWQPVYDECERLLGFSGNAASDVITAWSRIASSAYDQKVSGGSDGSGSSGKYFQTPVRRASSLSVIPKSVRTPVDLITLERARAQTVSTEEDQEDSGNGVTPVIRKDGESIKNMSLDDLEKSLLQMSIEHSIRLRHGKQPTKNRVEISGPLHLQEEVISSYPPTCSIDNTTSWIGTTSSNERRKQEQDKQDSVKQLTAKETKEESTFDPNQAIQRYIDKAFNTPSHPMGILMNNLEDVFRDSYGGIGANRFLLPHAIAEVHCIIKRLHSIIRILFPFLGGNDPEVLTNAGLHRMGMSTDLDDFVCIESGYQLLHPLVFMRLFPTLIMLYILHHVEDDRKYQRGIDVMAQMNEDQLTQFIHLPIETKKTTDKEFLQSLNHAANVLYCINSLYTPGEFLTLFKSAFKEIHSVNKTGDVILPSVVFIIVRAKLQHLGAYLHFLTDFAKTNSEEEYILVTYEAAYKFVQKQNSSMPDNIPTNSH